MDTDMKIIASLFAGCALVLAAAASANGAAIVLPVRTGGYTVTVDPAGHVQPFTIVAAGLPDGATVNIEQCDGVPADTPNWSPNEHCDSATAPSSQTVGTDGTVRFEAGDANFGFTPFFGDSPQHLFNCVMPGKAAPRNHQQSFTTCQVRVASSLTDVTADQAFMPIRFASTSAAIKPFTTTTLPGTAAKGRGRKTAASTTPTSLRPDPNAPIAHIAAGNGRTGSSTSSSSSDSALSKIGKAVISIPGLIFIAIWAFLGVALYRRYRQRSRNAAPAR
jgi:hypothetical protein